ncbi:response regulator transcription factor [Kaistella montana]|nr:response regulator transcription factor [Kaistella montana]
MTEAAAQPIRVVVVDDQALQRTGIALILDSAPSIEVVGEAGSGEAALDVVAQTCPEVVLMDVRMPGMGGIAATRLLVERHPAVRVAVLTTFDLDEYAFDSLQTGASAFLLKSTTPEALVEAVRTVAGGESVVAPRVTTRLIQHFVDSTQAPQHSRPEARREEDPMAVLSPRERDIFEQIVRGLTNAEIGAHLHLVESTVKSHINSIFAKLHLRDRVHAVILGYDIGMAGQGP